MRIRPGHEGDEEAISPPHYGADLAHIHHEHFRHTAEAAAAELVRRLRSRGVSSGTVVDLACGSGLLSRRALDAGFEVLGIDVSPPSMLDHVGFSFSSGWRRTGKAWEPLRGWHVYAAERHP